MNLSHTAVLAYALLASTLVSAQSADVKERLRQLQPADFPARPIEFVVNTPAGGGMDVTARLLAQKFQDYTGQPALVLNRPGAGGLLMHTWITTKAPKDGYSLGIMQNTIVGDSMLRSEGKWSYKDLDSVAYINHEPVVWLASATGRFKDKSLADILKEAKKSPQSVSIGVVSDTLLQNIADQVELASGTELNKIPFQGGAPALHALMGDQIDLTFGFFAEFRGSLSRVRPVAVASAAPVATLPATPTFDSILGTQDVQWMVWRYVAMPKGVPPARRAWLAAAFAEVLNDPELLAEFKRRGALTDRANFRTSEQVSAELDRLAESERRFYIKVGRIKP
ncbi:tripartite tricarboxylate transporter substrate binding protein [Caenimonas aquaedulcis]|uniref:Tripartite tricarboxylate transporter substrate binding protein n=1 Tax=Caenimonas aquaedulcis TaxID=2793270 RepID=A0A931MJA7_9BURK|nr:tripartite tricarboxylate transporter substrate binding protein [Caenimonas aquaedulcis]MBG9390588.1 tripartite tricarboxylate transporter substrate binding protein [Caenimonas aquaedulcis]